MTKVLSGRASVAVDWVPQDARTQGLVYKFTSRSGQIGNVAKYCGNYAGFRWKAEKPFNTAA